MKQKTSNYILFVIVIACCLFSFTISKQLYMMTAFRHGARYPLNDIYDGKQTSSFHGNLTTVGLRQHYNLGSYIKRDYASLRNVFNMTLNPREIEIFTLNTSQCPRCSQSAYAHSQGLFSFGSGNLIDPNIDQKLLFPPFETIFSNNIKSEQDPSEYALQKGFQPVPIRQDEHGFRQCQNAGHIYSRRGQSIAIKVAQLQLQFVVLIEEMRTLFNLSISQSNIGGLVQLHDTLICDEFLGRTFPSKLKPQQYEKLNFIQVYLMTMVYEQDTARIFNAPFINKMISNMEKIIKGQLNKKKLSIYSAHDVNVLPLLTYYNLTTSQCVRKLYKNQTVHGNCARPIPFASNIIFELHQNDNNSSDYFVKVRYNGDYFNLCQKNSTQCPFDQFAKRSRAKLMDFDKQCQKKSNKNHFQQIQSLQE